MPRTTVTSAEGEELRILRRNTAYGTPSKHGTVFVGFSTDRARLQLMLDRMAGVVDGVRDQLTRVTKPLTGGYFYVPALEELASFARGDVHAEVALLEVDASVGAHDGSGVAMSTEADVNPRAVRE